MTPDQIAKMALEAGFGTATSLYQRKEIQRFAKLVRNEVLEEAAVVCDQRYAACPQVLAEHIRGMKS